MISTYHQLIRTSSSNSSQKPPQQVESRTDLDEKISTCALNCFKLQTINFFFCLNQRQARTLLLFDELFEPLVLRNMIKIQETPATAVHYLKGSQKNCEGYFDKEIASEFLDRFSAKAPKGIYLKPFSQESSPIISGGTCSAATLSFLAHVACYLKQNASIENIISVTLKTHAFSNRFFRQLQAVMNQIALVDPFDNPFCMAEKKAEMLAHFFKFQSEQKGFYPFDDFSPAIFEYIENGLYFIRAIKFDFKKDSGEFHGHSLGFIKTDSSIFCFDPNLGVLTPATSTREMMRSILISSKSCFEFDMYGLYKLYPQSDFFNTIEELQNFTGLFLKKTDSEDDTQPIPTTNDQTFDRDFLFNFVKIQGLDHLFPYAPPSDEEASIQTEFSGKDDEIDRSEG